MKIVAILMLRDEEDIIDFTLSRFSQQFDEVYVLDTGSIDSTWERVLALVEKHENIIPLQKTNLMFSDALRGIVWEKARIVLRDGDWFARVDADEVYHVAPREFIRSAVEPFAGQVYCQYYDFQPMTEEFPMRALVPDLAVEKRLRHYRVSSGQGEVRLFKYRSSMMWRRGENGPRGAGIVARRKIAVRHYPARSEEQLKKRNALRAIMRKEQGVTLCPHWELACNDFLGKQNDPNLLFFKPGEEIQLVDREDHIPGSQTGWNVCWQRLLHGSGLIRFKDLLWRWKNAEIWKPTSVPQDVTSKIKSEYMRISDEYHNI